MAVSEEGLGSIMILSLLLSEHWLKIEDKVCWYLLPVCVKSYKPSHDYKDIDSQTVNQ